MAKVILNKDYGGFSVSAKAHKLYAERLGKELFYYIGHYEKPNVVYKKVSYEEFIKNNSLFYFNSFKDLGDETTKDIVAQDEVDTLCLDESYREDPLLIQIVEELGEVEASGRYSTLKVVEIPDELANGNYMIDVYDGIETLHAIVEEY